MHNNEIKDDDFKDTFIQFRISSKDKEILKIRAKELKMSLSQYIVYYLFKK